MTTIDRSSRSRDEAGGNCAFNAFDRPCREHTRLINRTRTTLNRGGDRRRARANREPPIARVERRRHKRALDDALDET